MCLHILRYLLTKQGEKSQGHHYQPFQYNIRYEIHNAHAFAVHGWFKHFPSCKADLPVELK